MSRLCDQINLAPISNWRLAWRLEQWGSRIPENHLAQMFALNDGDSRRVWSHTVSAGIHDALTFKRGLYSTVESLRLNPVERQEEFKQQGPVVKKWLFHRGVPFRQRVYLSYQPDTAVVTTWKMVILYWDLFYYSISDDLTVIDDSSQWALLFFHEHEVFWGSKRRDE